MRNLLKGAALAVFALGLMVGGLIAQTSNYLPVPSNIFAAKGALAVSQDTNNLTAIAAVATGQVLVSAGTGTLPAWSAAPSLTSLTLGASGTAITQMRIYSSALAPSAVTAGVCAEQGFTVTGITTADKLVINRTTAPSNPIPAVAARPSGADTVAITFCNTTAGTDSPDSDTYNIIAIRS